MCCVTEAGGHWIENAGKNDQGSPDYMSKDARTNSSAVVKRDRRIQRRRGFRFGLWPQTVYRTSSSRFIFTGRHHQIRVQMAHAGLPLFGDRKYNPDWVCKGVAGADGK
ncbi:MAG: hypothetical protein ACLURV_11680 [Gallintestinimicrobium sp.]